MSSADREHREVQSALAALAGPDGAALLAHLRECGECSHALAGAQDTLLAALYLPPPRSMDPGRAEEVRARILARTGAAPGGQARSARRGQPLAAAGWLAAGVFSVLLLTHHAFHQPLGLGWPVAAALGAALLGAALYVVAERRRSAVLRERLAGLEAELARIRVHARWGGPALGSV